MSVEPGFGGQSFMPEQLSKVVYLRDYMNQNNIKKCLIEIDGGINAETGKLARMAGVDVLVAGSYIFNSDNVKERIDSLRV